MLVWWFVGVQPCFNALIEDHVPVVSDVADSSEPFGILVELGLLLLGIGSDHANAYPFLGSCELPPNARPRLR